VNIFTNTLTGISTFGTAVTGLETSNGKGEERVVPFHSLPHAIPDMDHLPTTGISPERPKDLIQFRSSADQELLPS
jgi:hypothetical protein